jgi:hypothetical protein
LPPVKGCATVAHADIQGLDTSRQTRPPIGPVHWCSSARPVRATYGVAGDGPPEFTKLSCLAVTDAALDIYAPWAYSAAMFTVVETQLFQKQWPAYWTEEERGEFAAFLSANPEAGDVVPESGGIRKVRWKRQGTGKSGGVRVIYFTRNEAEELVLLTLYAKSKTDNLAGAVLKEIRRALEN